MTPLFAKHCNIESPVGRLACSICSIGADIAIPVTLLVVGIFGKFSVLPISPAASFGLLGTGTFLSLLSIGSWGKYIYQRRQSTSSTNLETISTSSTTSWEDKIFCSISARKETLIGKIQDKSSTKSPYGCILFFEILGAQPDIFFDAADGFFAKDYAKIMEATGDFIIFILPNNEEHYKRWIGNGYTNYVFSLSNERDANFVTQKKPKFHILTRNESYAFNSWMHGESSSPPGPIKKALGF